MERAKQEQLFDQEGAHRFKLTHDVIHGIAAAMQFKYQTGDLIGARAELEEFNAAFDEMNLALEQCVSSDAPISDSFVT